MTGETLSQQSVDNGLELIARIGQLTRALHENMRELGLDKEVEKAAQAIPDARDRLNYIATMTEQAAERALTAAEAAQPLQDNIERKAVTLAGRWDGWFDQPIELTDARELVADTRAYLQWVPEQTRATNAQLLEIMMAQDFQDLTGQVIKKMMDVIREIERQLVQVLIDHMPEDKTRDHAVRSRKAEAGAEGCVDNDTAAALLNGPQIRPEGRTDVVTDQAQVDDLLDSLGF